MGGYRDSVRVGGRCGHVIRHRLLGSKFTTSEGL